MIELEIGFYRVSRNSVRVVGDWEPTDTRVEGQDENRVSESRVEGVIVTVDFLHEMMTSLDGDVSGDGERVFIEGLGTLPAYFDVTGLATASMGAAGLLLAKLSDPDSDLPSRVRVDQRLASHWFGMALRPSGWELPSVWDDLAGDFQAEDGWIRLHTNAPAHRAAALSALGCDANRACVEAAVSDWSAST